MYRPLGCFQGSQGVCFGCAIRIKLTLGRRGNNRGTLQPFRGDRVMSRKTGQDRLDN
jgi:hypothetical protein